MTFRVAHVNVARSYRGGERQTELLIREFAGKDVEQVLVVRRGAPLAERLDDVDIEIRPVAGHLLSVTAATGDVDIVQVHEGRSVYGAYLRYLLSGTPYVLTRRVDNPIKNNYIAKRAYRSAACVVAVAEKVADVLKAYDEAINVAVIHSGSSGLPVDGERVAQIRGEYPGKFIIGNVGALDNSQKAQEHIIGVARNLAATHPEFHFMLVGGGDDEALLKRLASGLDNVTFTGFVDNVGDYLASFDLFILPSRREGIGSILLDAMDRKLAVIAASVGGVPNIVFDGDNGVLIDADRPDQLEAAILKLAADPELRAAMGQRGSEIAKNYTAPVMADKYFALYEKVLGRRPG